MWVCVGTQQLHEVCLAHNSRLTGTAGVVLEARHEQCAHSHRNKEEYVSWVDPEGDGQDRVEILNNNVF